jgi:hypothetical protein
LYFSHTHHHQSVHEAPGSNAATAKPLGLWWKVLVVGSERPNSRLLLPPLALLQRRKKKKKPVSQSRLPLSGSSFLAHLLGEQLLLVEKLFVVPYNLSHESLRVFSRRQNGGVLSPEEEHVGYIALECLAD